MFEIKHLTKRYGDTVALDDVSFNIDKGMTFITGPSGSGKSTLLKLMCALESPNEGNVLYWSRDLASLTDAEKRKFYNRMFGFVWQDYNLIEEWNVMENVMLPAQLNGKTKDEAMNVLSRLHIADLASQPVRLLSGGQKQHVAMARELMKDPRVIFADEPTSALDAESSNALMKTLREEAEHRAVIIVTHDTSLIQEGDAWIELDKGELVSVRNGVVPPEQHDKNAHTPYELPLKNAFHTAWTSMRRKPGRSLLSIFCIFLSALMMTVATTGTLDSSIRSEFNELIDTFGENVMDITIAGSFMSASGGDENVPFTDINQDISGLYEQYATDERVEFAVYSQALDNITVKLDGSTYPIEDSSSTPVLSRMLFGTMPSSGEYEVIVPSSFVEMTGETEKSILEKEIELTCEVVNWDSGEPVWKPASVKVIVCGVAENIVHYDYEGEIMSFDVPNSFFLSKDALTDLRAQAGMDSDAVNFIMRARTPKALLEIRDELNAQGIVPTGYFELMEGLTDLEDDTAVISQNLSNLMIAASIALIVVAGLVNAGMRKKETAIFEISGFGNTHLLKMLGAQALISIAAAWIVMLAGSPLWSMAAQAAFGISLLNPYALTMSCLWTAGADILETICVILISFRVNLVKILKAEEN